VYVNASKTVRVCECVCGGDKHLSPQAAFRFPLTSSVKSAQSLHCHLPATRERPALHTDKLICLTHTHAHANAHANTHAKIELKLNHDWIHLFLQEREKVSLLIQTQIEVSLCMRRMGLGCELNALTPDTSSKNVLLLG